MTLDYQQVRKQVTQFGVQSRERQQALDSRHKKARDALDSHAHAIQQLRMTVEKVVRSFDPSMRCALPVSEPLNARFAAPRIENSVTVLAADGSQINPDRHAEVAYCLINVGAIVLRSGSPVPPEIRIQSRLLSVEELEGITVNTLALRRDLEERSILAELAPNLPQPVYSFTDGPMELWGSGDTSPDMVSQYQQRLGDYLKVLEELRRLGVVTAGYVDRPVARPVVRLLEIADTPEDKLPEIKKNHTLQGVLDDNIFSDLLAPGERSALFAWQSPAASSYPDELGIHFFYLNVGEDEGPWVARVEVPGWVAGDPDMLGGLHATLVEQCRMMGSRPYPYLLHRAHETALVTHQDRDQVTNMLVREFLSRGIPIPGRSHKQALKDSAGRTRYKR